MEKMNLEGAALQNDQNNEENINIGCLIVIVQIPSEDNVPILKHVILCKENQDLTMIPLIRQLPLTAQIATYNCTASKEFFDNGPFYLLFTRTICRECRMNFVDTEQLDTLTFCQHEKLFIATEPQFISEPTISFWTGYHNKYHWRFCFPVHVCPL